MGRRGPSPKPTTLKLLAGNPGRRPLNAREPTPEPGVPKCPSWLDKDAKAIWRQLVRTLERMRLLTKADRFAMERYCELSVRWRRAALFIQKHGEAYPIYETGQDGKRRLKFMQPFPQVAVCNQLGVQLSRFEQEFGLTPSSRSRLQVTEKEETSGGIRDFLFAKKA